jgi:hypothetical protein
MEVEPGSDPGETYATVALALAEYPECAEEARRVVELGRAELEAEEEVEVPDEMEEGEEEAGEGEESPEAEEPTEAETAVAEEAEETDLEEGEAEEEGEEEASPEEKALGAKLSAALGLVLVQEGRLDEAEEELILARDLDEDHYRSSPVLLFSYLNAGTLMEKRAGLAEESGAEEEAEGFLAAADEFYLEGVRQDYYPSPNQGLPWVNPNEVALEALYEKRNGGLEGFEEYLLSATDEGWEERKVRILRRRLEEPKPMVTFALETLDGEEVTSESLLGKVLVINFWGTW